MTEKIHEPNTWAEGYYNAVTNPPKTVKQLRFEISFIVLMHFEKANNCHNDNKFDEYNEGMWQGLIDNATSKQYQVLVNLYNEIADSYYQTEYKAWLNIYPNKPPIEKVNWA